jgi:hypothetical protein
MVMVCRVCGADSWDEVCPECRQSSSAHGNGCAICDGFGGMPVNGTWTICPNCSQWDMGGQHYRNINNRSVVMIDPERFVEGVRRIRDLTEQRDALVAALEERDNVAAKLITERRAAIAALAALMDWQQPGCESHFEGVMVQIREAEDRMTQDAVMMSDDPMVDQLLRSYCYAQTEILSRRGMTMTQDVTRASREQVEDVLLGAWVDEHDLHEAICRDWLDMQARLGAAERALTYYANHKHYDDGDRGRRAIVALAALTSPARDETKEKE